MVDIASSDPNSPEFKQLHEALGRGLTTWQGVEAELYRIFQRITDCLDEDVKSAIFFSPRGFNEKLKCTHNVIRFVLKDDDFLSDWKSLRKRMIDASQVRNCMAHFTLVRFTEVNATGDVILSELQINANFFDATLVFKKDDAKTIDKLNADEIIQHTETFLEIIGDAKKFLEKIRQQ